MSTRKPSWVELPPEITATILHRLEDIEILTSAQHVCRAWRRICRDASMWQSIDIQDDLPCDIIRWDTLDRICRQAADFGQGKVNDITIGYFGDDDLLAYIVQRCKQLKRIRIMNCRGIGEEGLTQAVRYLPSLEELQLDYTEISAQSIKNVGIQCPDLKSFKLSNNQYSVTSVSDLEAQAIAKYMPELRHLKLTGSALTNEGLKAILDGCPYLESFDLRESFGVYLGGYLGTMCSQRVKHLKRPNDPFTESDPEHRVNAENRHVSVCHSEFEQFGFDIGDGSFSYSYPDDNSDGPF